jgi:hypothetical protein
MKRSHFKLGSQLWDAGNENNPATFEWNLCYEFNGRLVSFIPLGISSAGTPILKAAGELAQLLNDDQPEAK